MEKAMSTLKITRGSTYADTLYWDQGKTAFLEGTLIPGAPARIAAVAHGLPPLWFVRVEGYNVINGISPTVEYECIAVDDDTLELVGLNGTGFRAAPVVVAYYPPVDLTGYSARMQIRDDDGNLLVELLSTAAEGAPRLTIDPVACTIKREIPATVTAAITVDTGVFDTEMVNGAYVTKIDSGAVTIGYEVTR